MEKIWPAFRLGTTENGLLAWHGPLRGAQKYYDIGVLWDSSIAPFVFVLDPKIVPRPGGTYEAIPHLLFNEGSPEDSALCLFDPNGREWDPTMLIAETTLPWAGRWLLYYELWHVDGIWRGGGVGPESIAAARAANPR
jgi:hypothetical protein